MWTTEKTLSTIQLLHNAPCLWDYSCIDYKNRSKRKESIQNMADQNNVSFSDMEKKIHSLKTQFRRENKKVNESKRSGCYPNSVWIGYDPLLFLIQGHVDEDGDDVGLELKSDFQLNSNYGMNDNDPNTIRNESIVKIRSNRQRKIKKRKSFEHSENTDCMKTTHDISSSDKEENEFDTFGRSVALQLKQLPLEDALELQNEIQNNIIQRRLRVLRGQYPRNIDQQQPSPSRPAISYPTSSSANTPTQPSDYVEIVQRDTKTYNECSQRNFGPSY